MTRFVSLLRDNRNYRYTWMGQVVSEIGDHFNNIAVFSLAVQTTHSGLVVSGVLLARAIPAVLAGPLAGRHARPSQSQARHDCERPDPRSGGAGLHPHGERPRRPGCSTA